MTGTDQDPEPGLRELVAATDWSATPLGSPETWSEALRTTVETCLGSRFPVIIFWGPELVQVYNDAYRHILGTKHPAALGQRAEECFPEIWDVVGPMLRGVVERGEATWSDDLLLMLERRGFAEECYFTFSYSPAGAARVEGVFCAVIETTRRVIGERRLDVLADVSSSLAGAAKLSEALDAALASLGRHPSDLPAGCLRLLGDDRQGAAADRSWPADLSPQRLGELERVLAGGAPGARRANGSPAVLGFEIASPSSQRPVARLAVELNSHVLVDDSYRDFLALVVAALAAGLAGADAHEQAEQRARALEELDRAKTTFLSNVSHEFRTPLTLLLGPLHDHLADGRLPPEVRAGLEMAERNGRRLLRLVNSLLDFARLEAGRFTASFRPVDLAELTTAFASLFRSAAEAAGLDLVVDCPPLAGPVTVDPEMWEQIVSNLVANALKFTPAGSIEVRLRSREGEARLEVVDTGVGIPAGEIGFVFDRFRRASAPGARVEEGTGIGLSIVHELVELHGGTVSVESAEGHGCRFLVSIPLEGRQAAAPSGGAGAEPAGGAAPPRSFSTTAADVAATLQPVPVAPAGGGNPTGTRQAAAASAARPAGTASTARPAGSASAARPAGSARPAGTASTARPAGSAGVAGAGRAAGSLVVVDDSADMRSYLGRLLGQFWDVATFADGAQALAAIRRSPPDLVLSDVMMPGLDGFSFLAELRADPSVAHVPVILLSARAGEEATLEGLEAGADDYLVKPFTAKTLLARVRSHLEIAALRREHAERSASHARQLGALADAAIEVLSAQSLEAICLATERSACAMTGAATSTCSVGGTGQSPAGALPARPAAAPGEDRWRRAAGGAGEDPPGQGAASAAPATLLLELPDWDGSSVGWLRLSGPAEGGFAPEDRALVAELATVAGRRIGNFLRYERGQRVADTLQRSLLPRSLPLVGGLEIAAGYRSASHTAEVGGDFYDAIVLGGGLVMAVVGDVVGHDLDAAVAMGALRHLLRAHAPGAGSAGELLATINRLLPVVVDASEFATAVVVVLEPGSGRASIVSAGHLPPVLVSPAGDARLLEVPPGPPLGATDDAHYPAVELVVQAGATLLLYTDGLVERRGELLDVSLARMVEHSRALVTPGLEQALETLLDGELAQGAGGDDVAVLAVRRSGGAEESGEAGEAGAR